MKCKYVIEELEKRWNPSWALDWDNVGLLTGDREQEVKTIYVALDVTDENLQDAIRQGADMIITHHPLLFSPVKKITADDFIGRRIIGLIKNEISYYAMHTNFDVMGMAALNQEMMGLHNAKVLEVTGENDQGKEEGIGRIGDLETDMLLRQYAGRIKEEFQIPDVRVYGNEDKKIHKVAVCSGSGKSLAGEAIRKGADVLVTGDVDYHTAIDLMARGLSVIDAGHYGTEYCFISYMEKQLKEMFPQIKVIPAKVKHPYHMM